MLSMPISSTDEPMRGQIKNRLKSNGTTTYTHERIDNLVICKITALFAIDQFRCTNWWHALIKYFGLGLLIMWRKSYVYTYLAYYVCVFCFRRHFYAAAADISFHFISIGVHACTWAIQ